MNDQFIWLKSKLIIATALILIMSSCSSGNRREDSRPTYNQQPSYNNYQNQHNSGQYYGNQPQQQQPYYGSPYQYNQPSSRYYSNPYALPPRNSQQYYDGDQYYVAPSGYNAYDQDNVQINPNQKH
ncbi:MAG: hypothetical protein ACJAW3_001564 [Lentimonas sp.]|jgi:hypothetical protein